MHARVWMLTGITLVVILTLTALTAARQPAPPNWPRFRGPDALMATPATLDRTMYARGQHHLFAIRAPAAPAARAEPSAQALGVGPREHEGMQTE